MTTNNTNTKNPAYSQNGTNPWSANQVAPDPFSSGGVNSGAGISGMSPGLYSAITDYINSAEFAGTLTDVYHLYTPIYCAVGQPLPARASDGQTAFCLVSNTIDGGAGIYGPMWQFRYVASEAGSGYPWFFVGGADYRAEIATSETTTNAINYPSFQDLTTVGPSFYPLMAGYYQYKVQADMTLSSSSVGYMAVNVNGTIDTSHELINSIPGTGKQTMPYNGIFYAPKSGATIKVQYSHSGGGSAFCTFATRSFGIIPIRVAGIN